MTSEPEWRTRSDLPEDSGGETQPMEDIEDAALRAEAKGAVLATTSWLARLGSFVMLWLILGPILAVFIGPLIALPGFLVAILEEIVWPTNFPLPRGFLGLEEPKLLIPMCVMLPGGFLVMLGLFNTFVPIVPAFLSYLVQIGVLTIPLTGGSKRPD